MNILPWRSHYAGGVWVVAGDTGREGGGRGFGAWMILWEERDKVGSSHTGNTGGEHTARLMPEASSSL